MIKKAVADVLVTHLEDDVEHRTHGDAKESADGLRDFVLGTFDPKPLSISPETIKTTRRRS